MKNRKPTIKRLAQFSLAFLIGLLSFTQSEAKSPSIFGNINLLENPGFEAGFASWTTVGEASLSADAQAGNQAGKLCGDSYGSIGQILPTTPGREYQASFYAKVEEEPSGLIRLRFLVENYAPISSLNNQSSSNGLRSSIYMTRELYATAPNNAAYVHFVLEKGEPGCVLLDEVTLYEGIEAPASYIFINCLYDFSVTAEPGANGATVNYYGYGANSTESCAPVNFTITEGPDNGGYFPIGVTQVCIKAENSCGDEDNCCFNITVESYGGDEYLADFWLESIGVLQRYPPGHPLDVQLLSDYSEVAAGNELEIYQSVGWETFPKPATAFSFMREARISTDQLLDANDILITTQTSNVSPPYDPVVLALVEGGWGKAFLPADTPPGQYYFIAKFDAGNDVSESDEGNNEIIIPITVTPPVGMPNGDIDLELNLTQSVAAPDQWSTYDVITTITNTGIATASGIAIDIQEPDGVVYVGGNEFELSQGSFNQYTDQVWQVGELTADATATMTIHYFSKVEIAPVSYAQVIAANEMDLDSTPGNGTPPNVNEDDEASTSGGTADIVDLTAANLSIDFYSPLEKEIDFSFDLQNLGNVDLSIVRIKQVLSLDTTIDDTDLAFYDGYVSALSAGETRYTQSGVIYNNTPPGDYYIIIKVDGYDEVAELNENNNLFYAPIRIESFEAQHPCGESIGPGQFSCLANLANGKSTIALSNGAEQYQATMNIYGGLESLQELPNMPDNFTINIQNGVVTKRNTTQNNNVVFEKTMPAQLAEDYHYFSGTVEFNEGFVLFAYKNLDPTTNVYDALWAIKTDSDLNPLLEKEIGAGGLFTAVGSIQGLQINANELAYVNSIGLVGNRSSSLVVMDDAFNELSNSVYAYGYTSGLSIFPKPCGNFELLAYSATSFCIHGSCSTNTSYQGTFENGIFVSESSKSTTSNTSYGAGYVNHSWSLNTADGGQIIASQSLSLPGDLNSIIPINFTKLLNGNTIEEFSIGFFERPSYLIELNGAIHAIIENDNGTEVIDLECLESSPIPLQADLTLSAFELPATIVKGETTGFNFDLNNIGNVKVDGTYTIKVYISETPELMTGAAQVGEVNSGYTSVGTLGNVQGTVTIDQANVFIGGSIFPVDFEAGDYYLFLVADGDDVIDELDETNNRISAAFTLVADPATNQGVDVELNVELSTTAPNVWNTYSATYSIQNTGTETATGIEVHIPRPADVVYVGGGAYASTAGTFNVYSDRYQLNQLAAGETQTILLNYFLRGTSSQAHYAQVTALAEQDNDSVAGNGSCCAAAEDDETFIATEEIQNRRTVYELYDQERVEVLRIFPNPVFADAINLSIGAPAEMEQLILVYDARGQEVQRSIENLQKGFNTIQLNTNNLVSGQYRIILPGWQMKRMENVFLITR